MNLSQMFVKPYNNRFDWDGLLVIFVIEISFLVMLSIIKEKVINCGVDKIYRFSRTIDIAVLLVYITLVLSQTWLLSSRTYVERINLSPFWSYNIAIQWHGGLKITNSRILEQVFLNIIMFIPFGYLLPMACKPFSSSPCIVIVAGCILSVIIEIGQYNMHIGLCELDDVFNNELGCIVGLLIWRLRGMICFHKKIE